MPDSPDPARTARKRYSLADEIAWYATLATMFGAAAALFTNPAGRILAALRSRAAGGLAYLPQAQPMSGQP